MINNKILKQTCENYIKAYNNNTDIIKQKAILQALIVDNFVQTLPKTLQDQIIAHCLEETTAQLEEAIKGAETWEE